MKDMIPNTPEIDKDISKALHSLYWFNIWFAVEASKDEVRKLVIRTLRLDRDLWSHIDQLIDQKVADCSDYKMWVEERSENTPKIHD